MIKTIDIVGLGALETAMEESAHLVGDDTVLLSVLNGIRSEEDLGRRFGGEKVVHCGEPSMRQDSKAGRKTEVALFAGTICELGEKHGIAVPVNERFLKKFG